MNLDYLNAKIKVDEYVTHHRTLKEINEGFGDMHVSNVLKAIHLCSDNFPDWGMHSLRRRHVSSLNTW